MIRSIPRSLAYVVVEPCDDQALKAYLMRVPDGSPMLLEGVGALIWLLAAEGVDDVAAQVSLAVRQPITEVREVVSDFMSYLVSQGFLSSGMSSA